MSNALKDPVSLELFALADKDKRSFKDFVEKTGYEKPVVARAISRMEITGIFVTKWELIEGLGWQLFYRASNTEWGRLMREIVSVDSDTKRIP